MPKNTVPRRTSAPQKPKTKPAAKRQASVRAITGPFASDEHKIRLQAAQTAAAAKLELSNLDFAERAFLATCQDIYRNDIGCYTPFESFFADLVRWTMWGNPPTLESLRTGLADHEGEFVNNWSGVLHGVKRFVQNYPDLIAEFQNAAKQTEQSSEVTHA